MDKNDNVVGAGVKVVINQNLIISALKKYYPQIIDKINSITIPYLAVWVDKFLFKSLIKLENLKINVLIFSNDNVKVLFHEPNVIEVNLIDISGFINLDISCDDIKVFGFIPAGDTKISSTILIENISILTFANLSTEHSLIKNRIVPKIDIPIFEINFKLDYQIDGNPFISLVNNFKELIKDSIHKAIKDELISTLFPEIKNSINNLLTELPMNIPIENTEFIFDISLTKSPYIIDKNIILPINASLYSICNDERKNIIDKLPGYLPDSLEENNKSVQFYVSEFTLQRVFYTLLMADKLKIKLNSRDFLDFPIRLNSTSLSFFIKGLDKHLGKNKDVELLISVNRGAQSIILHSKMINLSISLNFSLEHEEKVAICFNSFINMCGELKIIDGYIIFSLVKQVLITESTIVFSELKDEVKLDSIEKMINFIIPFVIPKINSYLKDNKIKIPEIDGNYLDDCVSEIKNKYLSFDVNPLFK